MKSDYKLISLSQKDRIKTIVFNLITGAIILFLLVYYLVQGISVHLDKAIIGSILLLIGITIVMIFFYGTLKRCYLFLIGKSFLIKLAFIAMTRQGSLELNGRL